MELQLQEITLFGQDSRAFSVSSALNPNGSHPAGIQGPENVIDGHTGIRSSKWLDMNMNISGQSTLQLGVNETAALGAYELWTANDNPGRDPTGWTLSRHENGRWAVLDEQVCVPPRAPL